jgi:hypothetical protein
LTHPRHIREAMTMPELFRSSRLTEAFLRLWLWLDRR